jgi:hypothetical protein
MATWTLIPVGGVMVMVTPISLSREVMEQCIRTAEELRLKTGIPWVFLPDTVLVDAETVKEIADRLAGIER